MKQKLPVLGLTLLLTFTVLQIFPQGKIFIYLNSHNEDNIGYLNGAGGFNIYTQSRTALVQLAQLTQQKGAKQNSNTAIMNSKQHNNYQSKNKVV